MTGAEFLGYLAGDLYETWKKFIFRGFLTDAARELMLGIANREEVKCPVCSQYCGLNLDKGEFSIPQKDKEGVIREV
jgi:hypothetical protein